MRQIAHYALGAWFTVWVVAASAQAEPPNAADVVVDSAEVQRLVIDGGNDEPQVESFVRTHIRLTLSLPDAHVPEGVDSGLSSVRAMSDSSGRNYLRPVNAEIIHPTSIVGYTGPDHMFVEISGQPAPLTPIHDLTIDAVAVVVIGVEPKTQTFDLLSTEPVSIQVGGVPATLRWDRRRVGGQGELWGLEVAMPEERFPLIRDIEILDADGERSRIASRTIAGRADGFSIWFAIEHPHAFVSQVRIHDYESHRLVGIRFETSVGLGGLHRAEVAIGDVDALPTD